MSIPFSGSNKVILFQGDLIAKQWLKVVGESGILNNSSL